MARVKRGGMGSNVGIHTDKIELWVSNSGWEAYDCTIIFFRRLKINGRDLYWRAVPPRLV